MDRRLSSGRRGDAPVVGTLLLVAVVIVVATTASAYVLSDAGDLPTPAPRVAVSHETVPDGGERTVAVTMETGDAVRIDHLYVVGSVPVDVGGAPGSASPADEADASSRALVAERTGGTLQVATGATWDAGETIYVDPVGRAAGVSIRLYWSSRPVTAGDPTPGTEADAYPIAEFTVRPDASG